MRKPKCKNCNKPFTRTYTTLQPCCSISCAITYSKYQKKEQSEELEVYKKENDYEKKLNTLIASLVTVCHEYIRLRDKGKRCVTCLTILVSGYDAGHYYSGGKFTVLKFHENNIHGQCVQCNRRKNANLEAYTINIKNRLTLSQLKEIDDIAEQYKIIGYKHDRQYLIDKKKYYKQKLKELKQ